MDGEMQTSRPSTFENPLDDEARLLGKSVFTTVFIDGKRMRILSVPLRTERMPIGVLQVGMNLSLVEAIQQILSTILVFLAFSTMLLSALASWLVTSQALSPLSKVTNLATTITRADDLMRRIPLDGPAYDEVGQLILAFNQTLERLEKLFTSQGRLLADVSHELRTPLTVIKGNISIMRRMGEADEESLRSIEAEVDRLTRLVGDLLLLTQADAGEVPMQRKPVELDTVLLEVYQQMRILAGDQKEVHILEIDQIQVLADRDRIKQVFLNLVANAIQYTPQKGMVNLKLYRQDNVACFAVQDTGPGIAEEDIPFIFDRFYRGEKSRKRRKESGFGLGLSIAKWIVKNHGGSIDVESEAGKGTTFTVYLPVDDTLL
jgi:signal transduction histidine kinase